MPVAAVLPDSVSVKSIRWVTTGCYNQNKPIGWISNFFKIQTGTRPYYRALHFTGKFVLNKTTMTEREQLFMQAAIDMARHGMTGNKGGPFGCIIVKGDHIIGKGCNCVASHFDPTAHAEVVAIRDACINLKSFQLTGCEVYTSCEPCPMCMGAIYWARPERVYYAGTRYDAANAGFDDSAIYEELVLPFAERKIQMLQLSQEKAVELFGEWLQKDDRVEY